LSAHSLFVNDFLQPFANAKQLDPENQKTLDTLSHISIASKQEVKAPGLALPYAHTPRPLHRRRWEMPPIQNAVTLIRAAQGEHAFTKNYH
jgi:hypothetical protein